MVTTPGRRVEVAPPPRIASYAGLLPTLRNAGLVSESWQDAVSLAVASGQFVADIQTGTNESGAATFKAITTESALTLTGTYEAFLNKVRVVSGERFLPSFDYERWGNVEDHRPIGCQDTSINPPCDGDDKVTTEQPDIVEQYPFWVYADDTCSTWAPDLEERKFRAQANLVRHESNTIADELWTGDVATAQGWPNLSLSQSSTDLGSEAYPFALATLQEVLADCLGDGQAGIIHATRGTVQRWYQSGAIWYERGGAAEFWSANGYLTDVFDNIIVSSGGYDGSDPSGVIDPTVPYAYATGPVLVRLGAVQFIPDTFGQGAPDVTRDNLLVMRAERPVTYELDGCCVYGVGVDLCSDACVS